MNMNIVQNEGEVTINLEGRLDTVTAPELIEKVSELEFEKLIITMDQLEYISSAGLRALLICRKTVDASHSEMEVRYPNQEVYDVMKISGFSKVLNIVLKTSEE